MPIRTEFDDEGADIQMTPMIDCVFLLLIFFLVSSQMKKVEKELQVDLPDSLAALNVKASADMLAIGIDAAGRIHLGAEPVSRETLRLRLQAAAAANPNQRVRIDGDRAAPFQALVSVLDECHFLGLNNIGINSRIEANRAYYGP
ncbi:MAG: biopolymer transporter ExbD [Kiritimatiellaeota bacterium]|nr:biopolymer transporter ExbD [Kiritimatiellota bacterium]